MGITYTLDQAAPLVTVLAEAQLNKRITYLYGLGDSPLASDDGAAWVYLSGRDALNSVRQETDAAGQVLAARSFDPYGVVLSGDGGAPFGFTGEFHDTASGLVFLRARYLQVTDGRFITRDVWPGDDRRPITFNAWAYGGANPFRYTDPTGHWPEWVGFGIGAYGQYVNDLTFGLVYAVSSALSVDIDSIDDDSFQEGRVAGRSISQAQAVLEVGIGASVAHAALQSGQPLLQWAQSCAAGTDGLSYVVGGVALTAEGVAVLGGTAEATHGAGSLLYMAGTAPPGSGAVRTVKGFDSPAKLTDHFSRHGAQLGYKTEQEYLAGAQKFGQSKAGSGVRINVRSSNGDTVIFSEVTQEYAVIAKDGTIRTYFIPDRAIHGYPTNLDYFIATSK